MGNYAQLKYSYMIRDIRARAALNEDDGFRLQARLEDELAGLAAADPRRAASRRNQRLNAHAEAVRADWTNLFEHLVAKYAQGFVSAPGKMAQPVGYPQEWLDRTNYADGPAHGYGKGGK